MDIAQLYETTIVDRTSRHAARVLVVPRRSIAASLFPNPSGPVPLTTVASRLGLRVVKEITSASQIAPAFAAISLGRLGESDDDAFLDDAVLSWAFSVGGASARPLPPGVQPFPKDVMDFADYVANASIIPCEASPLQSQPLSRKFVEGLVTGAGTAVGARVMGAVLTGLIPGTSTEPPHPPSIGIVSIDDITLIVPAPAGAFAGDIGAFLESAGIKLLADSDEPTTSAR
jgi:hypothetical protein